MRALGTLSGPRFLCFLLTIIYYFHKKAPTMISIALIVLQILNLVPPTSPTLITTCTQLPFPDPCKNLPTKPFQFSTFSGFRHSHLLGVTQRLRQAYAAAMATPTSSFDNRYLAAWSDCMELYQDMSFSLQRSLSSSPGEDSQTWLSAALSALETCRDGFLDFGYDSQLSSCPFVSPQFNISQLLSNSLAIDKGGYTSPPSSPASRRLLAFPEWLSAPDRKLLQSSSTKANANLVVAQDGTGNYRTISDAVAAVTSKRNGTGRFVIYVKAGVYQENVQISSSLKNLMFVGDGIGATIVTGSKNVVDGSTTFQSATFATSGDGFIAQGMTFRNTAGVAKHQAVALRCGGDLSVFYQCSMEGYQDTLYVYSQRQFFRECNIYGTVDFVFGDSPTVLQKCNFFLRQPLSGQENTVTAQGRTDPNENTGISIHDSSVAATSGLSSSVKSYLGRPWKQYSRTVYLETSMDSSIAPAGWLEWSGTFALSTLYYGEYQNTGPGAATSQRVTWPGYHIITSATVASQFTVANFISGGSWLPATGVPFISGL